MTRQFRSLSHILFLLALCNLQLSAQATSPAKSSKPAGIDDPTIDARVESLLRKMTREEKVGQLVQYSGGQPTGPGTGRTEYSDMIVKGEVGALLNVTDPHVVNNYQHLAVEKSRLHVPLLFGLDVIHGYRTEFPVPIALASTWNPTIVEKAARVAARETSAVGIRWTFSPMVDISRDARWGRMTESAGEDTFLGSAMAAAYVRGYQGEHLDAPDSIAACMKHYVGYGAAEAGRDYNSTEISEHTLRQVYFPPFRAGVDAGAATVMTAFNSLNGVPSTANPFIIRQVLRKEWGFRGLTDSDWGSIRELIAHGVARDSIDAARKAMLAGVDMDLASSFYHDHLAQLVRDGKVPETELDDAVRHVLRVKFALGLFEHPFVDESAAEAAQLRPEARMLAREAAERSFVLLKNETADGKALLPLSSEVRTVALLGPLGDAPATMLGSWSAVSRAEDVVTLRKALVDRLGQDHVLQAKGADFANDNERDIAPAMELAKKAEMAILALGEDGPAMTGEAASRAHLGLPGKQQQLLEAAVATGKPVVLVLFSGRPLTVPWAVEHVRAILAAWFPGVEAGPALVRTLFGEANPSGKLVVSWPRSVGQEPLYYNALNTGRPVRNVDLSRPPQNHDEKFVSRYLDELNSPQFVFGYGDSYTTFAYSAIQANTTQLSAAALNRRLNDGASNSPVITIEADVTNTGSRAGEEVPQLYLRLEGTSTAQPVRSLKGFQRLSFAPGETKHVRFDLPSDAFALWNDGNAFAVEPAQATLWIGPDSAHGLQVSLNIVP
jgi:beta-glucosidase